MVELQRATDDRFIAPKLIYGGSDNASLRTGLEDGQYAYRVRTVAADGTPLPWSAPVVVTVQHHGALRTWGLFGLGALVFVATVGLIVAGTRQEAGHA